MSSIYARSIEVVGTPFRADLVEAFMDNPGNLKLVLEPDNPYDPNAIMVMSENKHLGYVPAHLARRMAVDGVSQRAVAKLYDAFWKTGSGKYNRAIIIFDILLPSEAAPSANVSK